MKHLILASAVLAALVFSGVAVAGDDCTDPVTDWQPREVLRQQLEERLERAADQGG